MWHYRHHPFVGRARRTRQQGPRSRGCIAATACWRRAGNRRSPLSRPWRANQPASCGRRSPR